MSVDTGSGTERSRLCSGRSRAPDDNHEACLRLRTAIGSTLSVTETRYIIIGLLEGSLPYRKYILFETENANYWFTIRVVINIKTRKRRVNKNIIYARCTCTINSS